MEVMMKLGDNGIVCAICGAEPISGAKFCSGCGKRIETAVLPKTSAIDANDPSHFLWIKFIGPEATKTRRAFRTVGGVIGGLVGLGAALGLFGLMREFLDRKPDPLMPTGGQNHGTTAGDWLAFVGMPLMFGGALWFIGYQIADKAFGGIQWVVKKIWPHG